MHFSFDYINFETLNSLLMVKFERGCLKIMEIEIAVTKEAKF